MEKNSTVQENNFLSQINDQEDDTPEGLDSSPDLEMHDYPLDSLLIRNMPRSIHEVCRRIEQGNYILDPDFQRDFIWNPEKQSRLIESLLMRIPLPVFYLAERYDGKVIVIDGLQRLTTISRYLNNEFALRNLDVANSFFAGKKFMDLSPKLQNRLEDTQLIMYILDEKVPERARLDIFERVNGGTPLSRQQMRNCMYCGPATLMLKDLAKEPSFLEATSYSLNRKTMRDREFINRYMAFEINTLDAYKGDMDDFLAQVLLKINKMSAKQIPRIKDKFLYTMQICESIWGKHTFRKLVDNQAKRYVINAALFDALSVTIGNFKRDFTDAVKENIRTQLFILFGDEEFNNAITLSTNSLRQVQIRFAKIQEVFRSI